MDYVILLLYVCSVIRHEHNDVILMKYTSIYLYSCEFVYKGLHNILDM